MGFALRKREVVDSADTKTAYNKDGEGRKRRNNRKSAVQGPSGCYQFSKFKMRAGKREALPVYRCSFSLRPEQQLISTAVINPTTGTETLLFLHFDLDYARADDRWKKDGKLDWGPMGNLLRSEVPVLSSYIAFVTRSTGEKGLSIALAISPLELIEDTAGVQSLAAKVQAMGIQVLNYYGMGADKGAKGLKRLMPNFFDTERRVDGDEAFANAVHSKRPRVLQNVMYELFVHPGTQRLAKKNRTNEVLWPDRRLEKPLAGFYLDMLDSVGPFGTEQLTAHGLTKRVGISKTSAYKILQSHLPWLKVTPIQGEGYRLQIIPTDTLTDRAHDVLSRSKPASDNSSPSFHTLALPAPERVQDGERNTWLKGVALALKWRGVEEYEAHPAVEKLVMRVPGWRSSASLGRNYAAIVASIYRNRATTFGSNPGLTLPDWLEESLFFSTPKVVSHTFTKKGDEVSRVLDCDLETKQLSNEVTVSRSRAAAVPSSPAESPSPSHGWLAETPLVAEDSAGLNTEPCPGAVCASPAGVEKVPDDTEVRRRFHKALLRSRLSAIEKKAVLSKVLSLEGSERFSAFLNWIQKLGG